ncbi:MAG: TolC family outer membrane protein [Rhizobiaceae bacterium]|nr:TolC family outer membrane protein [Rhizobiaceae bacterium]
MRWSVFLLVTSACIAAPQHANAESLRTALAAAYNHNPTLNAQRAATRAADEKIAQAKSGYRPTITGDANFGFARTTSNRTGNSSTNPYGYGITINQNLFDGFRTINNVASAEANIKASREQLRRVEQQILQSAASAYVDVLEAGEIVSIRRQNIGFLREQLRSSQARLDVGEGTRTDVAQSQARLSTAQATLAAAQASLSSTRATYKQVIGRTPSGLTWPNGPGHLYANALQTAIAVGMNEHPAIRLTQHAVDAAAFSVKSLEGAYLPTLSLRGNANRSYNSGNSGNRNSSVSATVNLSVPIYQGGAVSSQVREGRETLAQTRIQVDEARDEVRASVVSAWSSLQAANANVRAIQATVNASKLALDGVIEERNVGQRTQLEVLDSQSTVLDAKVSLVGARKMRVTAGYALVSAMGRLNSSRLGLAVRHYDPQHHFDEVKDMWIGLRTPSGR